MSKPTHLSDVKWRGLFLLFLTGMVLASMVSIVKVQHEIRTLESQYYQSLRASLQAKDEWGRLMLEKTHLTSPARVEKIARNSLGMTTSKTHYQTLYLMPDTQQMPKEKSNVKK
ncbi:cell division protein FtsL [Thiomicrorhabdus aquaedulcis]|uniref:cell division protein FtsL n=1 Tax=Thiomicrorhabdus aquaedulcis TaxID=2211106 RepID=UPI000FDA19C1|nr:cell division protein FtsL [Thiomicrorhabdus aquaedulcis]